MFWCKNFIHLYENITHKKCSNCEDFIFNKKNKNGICKKCLTKSTKEIKKEKIDKYCLCGIKIPNRQKFCGKCYQYNRRKVKNRPSYDILFNEIKLYGYVKVGKKYGVSDNTIRKWIKM